jgi:glycosyltransferase involved in cell wall biosynthesis
VTAGFFSPLPPARTGVADYAAALLGELRRHGRVEVAPESCDAALYHLGNNGLHGEIYGRALRRPGVVVLHDAVLHHFLLGRMSEAEYVEEFVHNYGEWNRGLAGELWRSRATSASDRRYFEFAMLRRACEGARAVVVHNPAAAERARRHAPATPVIEIPHLFDPSMETPAASLIARWRQARGFPPGAFVFGVFGYQRESKRLPGVLNAFDRLHREEPRAALLVAGDFVSSDLERAISPLLARPGIARVPHLPEQEFPLAAAAVDACINLRYPAAGETSGIAVRLMGMGKPVLVSAGLETSRFPPGACLRIASGAAEPDSLFHHMLLLTSMQDAARTIGQEAAVHIRTHHSIASVAALYWNVLCEFHS